MRIIRNFLSETEAGDQGEMVAVAGLIFEPFVGAAGTETAIGGFFFQQEQWGMDVGGVQPFV